MTTPQDPRSLDAIIDSLDESPSQTPPQEEYMAMMREANSPETKDRNLRDWFAGMALQGLCASTPHDDAPKASTLADWAFQQADAMLAARKEAK